MILENVEQHCFNILQQAANPLVPVTTLFEQ